MPHPKAPHDPSKSAFLPARHLEILADFMESVVRGEILKGFISMPPRHGKTETATNRTNAWVAGKFPEWDIVTATYGEKFAHDFKKNVDLILRSRRFRQVFPDYRIVASNQEQIVNHLGKNLFFLGRRSQTTGRGGNLILVDDPVKDDREVRYQAFRDDIWEWFVRTLLTRRHNDKAPIVVTATRWHEDDPQGRTTDPTNPCYSKEFADGWEVLNLPAIAQEDDPMGRDPGEALWPERFGTRYLEEMRGADPIAFGALYQGDPTPAEGVFYQAADIHTYTQDEMPDVKTMRFFCASDHAVATKHHNDATCAGAFGVVPDGTAYVMPDIAWARMDPTRTVDEMIRLMKKYGPLWWYAEKGHITQSLGPFLKKKMEEEGVYCPIVEDHPPADKTQRAQSARARCAQRRILFPAFAPWWPRAKNELLKFPNGRHDDFVDFVSIIGMKLGSHVSGSRAVKKSAPLPGSWGELKAQWEREKRDEEFRKERARR